LGPVNSAAELARLLQEIALLEAELKAASLRDPQILAEYARKIRQLRLEVLTYSRPPEGRAN
jgi:hypothetical protein